ncbi:MAG: ribonuclease HII [Alphaproteobacteria bacterium]|nr:ribonuclease HII [Alphaproteobacteria bacterium]
MTTTNNTPSFVFEEQFSGRVAGIDEAGCGPWAGPVVAAAVILDRDSFPNALYDQVKDSKIISRKKRERIADILKNHPAVSYGIGHASVEEIDALNISKATQLAMQRAVGVLVPRPGYALVDGIRKPPLDIPVQMIIKGDQQSFSIAAASILAKVERDCIMGELDQIYPQYNWKRNAGYGTREHHQAMIHFGITPHHRQSYAPVRVFLVKE